MYAMLPLLLAAGSVCFWSFYYGVCAKRLAHRYCGRFVASLIILLFLVHPNIVQYMFDNFNCKNMDGDQRVYKDMEIICHKGAHFFWAMFLAVPCIVIWGLGIPLFAWCMLSREKDKLDRLETREKFGFLFNGYRKEFYFW